MFFFIGPNVAGFALQFKHAIVSPHFQDTHSMNGYKDPGICERVELLCTLIVSAAFTYIHHTPIYMHVYSIV